VRQRQAVFGTKPCQQLLLLFRADIPWPVEHILVAQLCLFLLLQLLLLLLRSMVLLLLLKELHRLHDMLLQVLQLNSSSRILCCSVLPLLLLLWHC
jgi:hypothetical protein